jgi:hypothetical protein
MRDKELVLEVLRQTEDAAAKIVARFQPFAGLKTSPTVRPVLRKWMPSV